MPPQRHCATGPKPPQIQPLYVFSDDMQWPCTAVIDQPVKMTYAFLGEFASDSRALEIK